jgi:hypothetical protein
MDGVFVVFVLVILLIVIVAVVYSNRGTTVDPPNGLRATSRLGACTCGTGNSYSTCTNLSSQAKCIHIQYQGQDLTADTFFGAQQGLKLATGGNCFSWYATPVPGGWILSRASIYGTNINRPCEWFYAIVDTGGLTITAAAPNFMSPDPRYVVTLPTPDSGIPVPIAFGPINGLLYYLDVIGNNQVIAAPSGTTPFLVSSS